MHFLWVSSRVGDRNQSEGTQLDFTDQMRSCLAGHRVSYFLPFTELSYLGAIQCRGTEGIAKPAEAGRATSWGCRLERSVKI